MTADDLCGARAAGLDAPAVAGIADPNWSYRNWSEVKDGAAVAHYDLATDDEICDLNLGRFFAKDAFLALWCTSTKVAEGVHVRVLDAWGFRPVTMFPWVKTAPGTGTIRTGTGFVVRGAAEYVICARRGNPKKKPGAVPPNGLLVGDEDVFYAPRQAHSQKPLTIHGWIERTYDGPYVELYARRYRQGWVTLGRDLGWNFTREGVKPWPTP